MTTRRDFLRKATGAAAVLAGGPALHLRSRADADVILRGGTVFDGTGAAGREADVVITAGKISAITRRSTDKGAVEIDARGLAVSPGFIDIHSHGDGSLWEDPRAESLVRQGVTTIVVGQDGSSRAPRVRGGGQGDDSREPVRLASRSLERSGPRAARRSTSRRWSDSERCATSSSAARIVRRRRTSWRGWSRFVRAALADGACGVVDGTRVHAGRLRAARRADRALQAARAARASVRDAHAQRGRPRHRGDR